MLRRWFRRRRGVLSLGLNLRLIGRRTKHLGGVLELESGAGALLTEHGDGLALEG